MTKRVLGFKTRNESFQSIDYDYYSKNLNRQWNTGFFSGIAVGILLTCITFALLFIVYLNL